MAAGSRIDFEARFLGRRLQWTYEVHAFEPGERLVMRSADGPFPMETTYIWASVPDGTRVTLRDRCTPSGLAQVIAPVMAKAIRSAMTKDLTRLAERLRHRCTRTRAVQPDDPRRSRRTMVDVARAGHPPRPETSNR